MKFNIKKHQHTTQTNNNSNFLFRFDLVLVSNVSARTFAGAPSKKICFFSSYLFLCANSDYATFSLALKSLIKKPKKKKTAAAAAATEQKTQNNNGSFVNDIALCVPLWKIVDIFYYCHSFCAAIQRKTMENRLFRHLLGTTHTIHALSAMWPLHSFHPLHFSPWIWIMSIAIYKSNLNARWIAWVRISQVREPKTFVEHSKKKNERGRRQLNCVYLAHFSIISNSAIRQ